MLNYTCASHYISVGQVQAVTINGHECPTNSLIVPDPTDQYQHHKKREGDQSLCLANVVQKEVHTTTYEFLLKIIDPESDQTDLAISFQETQGTEEHVK